MITGPADHGLHVIQSCFNLIFLATTMSSFSYRFIVATTSSPLYRLDHKSALALFGAEVLCIACEPNKQFALIAGSQEKTTCRPTPFQIWWWWSKSSILTPYKGKLLKESQVKW